mmetsp:Transcript_32855/g.50234  ORF Transcript_32855/g.50234 Transcript_32855/m.50234 type:complete len:81 (+) Transcript_32855:807-1049(+)
MFVKGNKDLFDQYSKNFHSYSNHAMPKINTRSNQVLSLEPDLGTNTSNILSPKSLLKQPTARQILNPYPSNDSNNETTDS